MTSRLVFCLSPQGPNALVTYTIISGADDSFRIDPESGDLIATKKLDRERRSKYSLLVRADDGKQSSDMRLNITVKDVNDHTPKFSRATYSFDIPEDMAPGEVTKWSIQLQSKHTKMHGTGNVLSPAKALRPNPDSSGGRFLFFTFVLKHFYKSAVAFPNALHRPRRQNQEFHRSKGQLPIFDLCGNLSATSRIYSSPDKCLAQLSRPSHQDVQ